MYYLHRSGETTGPFASGRLRQMWDAGEITHTDQVCAHGTEEWVPADAIAAPTLEDDRASRSVPARPMALHSFVRPWNGISLFLGAIGIVTLFTGPIFGIITIIIAIAIDRKRYVCGDCGNRIEKTSTICPACQSVLVRDLPKKKK